MHTRPESSRECCNRSYPFPVWAQSREKLRLLKVPVSGPRADGGVLLDSSQAPFHLTQYCDFYLSLYFQNLLWKYRLCIKKPAWVCVCVHGHSSFFLRFWEFVVSSSAWPPTFPEAISGTVRTWEASAPSVAGKEKTHTHTDDAAESSVWRKRTTLFSRGFCQKVTLGEGTEAAVEPPSPPPIVPTQKARVKPAKAGQGGQKWLGHDCPPGPKSTATTGCERGGGEGI